MKSFYYFNPLYVIEQIPRKDVIQWSLLYKYLNGAVCLNDRSETLEQPLKTKILSTCVMPEFHEFQPSYADCVDQRAKEIFDLSEELQKPISVLWSGGIDSTIILVSFLKNYPLSILKDKIKVVMSKDALIENPVFYKQFVLPNFEIVNSHGLPRMFDSSSIIVTGEHNDQIFGSDTIRNFLLKYPDTANLKFDKDFIFEYINSSIKNDSITQLFIDSALEGAGKKSVNIEKNTDFFWWYNFCFKWHAVHLRIYSRISPTLSSNINKEWHETYMKHFFQSDSFQQWSVNNPSARYITDWKNYKLEGKKYIFDFDQNKNYFINKFKTASLQTLFEQSRVSQAITGDFEVLEKVDFFDYYNPDNSFNKI